MKHEQADRIRRMTNLPHPMGAFEALLKSQDAALGCFWYTAQPF
jgi:hypothetical protein